MPTVTLPKLSVVGLAAKAPADTPVPVTGMVKVGLGAFDVRVTFPLAAPLAAGVNVTLKVAVCPAFSVRGAVIPLSARPAPLIPTWEIVTLAPPVLIN